MKVRPLKLLHVSFILLLMLMITACGTSNKVEDTNTPANTVSEKAEETKEPEQVAKKERTITFITMLKEDEGVAGVLSKLAKDYIKENPHVTFKVDTQPQAGLTQKVAILAASNDLPDLVMGATEELQDIKQIIDIEKAFTELGLMDTLAPAAVALLKSGNKVQDGTFYGLPLEMNIEGIWYNKKMFADNNLQPPTTWDEMLAASDVFMSKGIQPFAVAGKEGWPTTRLLNGYVVRKLGKDAMMKVKSGEYKLTDPGFVEAATVLQEMGKKGFFGKGVNTLDYGTAQDLFLQGKAAMFYMGSWAIRDFNDPNKNLIGAENVGFFNVPNVAGGVGTMDQYSLNNGSTTSINLSKFDDELKNFLKYVFSRYGDRAMSENGLVSGFLVNNPPAEIPPLTKLTLDLLAKAKEGYGPFEVYFNSKGGGEVPGFMQYLVEGSWTPQKFLEESEKSIRSE